MKFLLKITTLYGFHLHQHVELGRDDQPTPLTSAPTRDVSTVQILLEFFQDTVSIIT